jgi:glycosyltransferase involved in cell wall biosynthesis
MRRALFIAPTLRVGGAERLWSILVPGLREHGWEARVLVLKHEGRFGVELRERGIRVQCAGMRHRADVVALARACRQLHVRPDVVVTLGVSAQIVGHLLARVCGCPHVFNTHFQEGRRLASHQERLLRFVAPHVDQVIAVSAGQVPDLTRRGYHAARINVIPSGIGEGRVRRDRATVRASLGIRQEQCLAILVAALRPEKRIEDFISGVALARESVPRLRGIVIGDGPERARLEALVAERGGLVRLVGAQADVASLMAAAEMLVLSSESEAVPVAILEAMAMGLPVVATAVGSVPLIVEHGVTGLLAPPRDPFALAQRIAELGKDAELRLTLGSAARRRHRERYRADQMIASYAEALHTLAEAHGRAPPRFSDDLTR